MLTTIFAVTRYTSLAAALVLACAGCGTVAPTAYGDGYITYTHPFTDAAAETVRRNAEKLCGDGRQVAMRTGGTCSLTECVTHFLCVDEDPGKKGK